MLLNFISIVVLLLSSTKYLQISSYCSKDLIPWAYSRFGLPSTTTETFEFWDCKTCSCLVCVAFFLKQNQDAFQGFTRCIKCPVPNCI